MPKENTLYTVIRNSLTHYKKSVHLNGAKGGNMPHADRKRNSPSLFVRAAGAQLRLWLPGVQVE
jgi:hypothetical protein